MILKSRPRTIKLSTTKKFLIKSKTFKPMFSWRLLMTITMTVLRSIDMASAKIIGENETEKDRRFAVFFHPAVGIKFIVT